ncbi:alpha/beta-hydrolase [Punctularia strigosozonata HHB-11173 SS5]|uniref:alpha/beta-hydrolase n=1 Tax=Punctularia strigosozonata (strain HHB-11173) TaxID=741275 RepID=UPI0004416FF9|nr:alpha/beta-hydrolase [Punctularia strigosozonata HHB-11173 SS5]EIN06782.1 alpha/beta-hydrolase [Punctularia strigosozonata HHB-11173 SS5]
MVNTLTGDMGLKLGPIVLETLARHYLDRLRKDGRNHVQLRQDEVLYDSAFHVIKAFLHASQNHTVEELQGFSNVRTPTPPWVHVVRLLVPMASCDEAATHLIEALGGPEVCKRVVGGTKWWQVRGVKGVDAEWITAKKDYEHHKKRSKAHERHQGSSPADEPTSPKTPKTPKGFTPTPENDEEPAQYEPEMDDMRCILFAHGGGYYFGSVDQERYSIQRYARKINGRIFAINYRLAPQYPFPCAIQDYLAAYLYLIRPPEGAAHRPVKPERIVVAGDSAGGGLTLALLQVIRDSGLPLPAGGVLISPWCDLSHSFPSIHTNTETDVISEYGLCMHRPSTLWPPPPDDVTVRVHSSLRSRIRNAVHRDSSGNIHSNGNGTTLTQPLRQSRSLSALRFKRSNEKDDNVTKNLPKDGETVQVGSTAHWPTGPDETPNQPVTLKSKSGKLLTIDQQVQLYCTNSLVQHPLVSPALSYLGGLPPLLFVISDKEVLRDEGIYTAHKAAHPERFEIKEEARRLYPALDGIEERYGPTQVHLQVYDDAAHVLPVLFAFTTPAKFCYRAISTFCKYTTGMLSTAPEDKDAPKAGSMMPNGKPEIGLGFGRRPSMRTLFNRSFSVDVNQANGYNQDPQRPKTADRANRRNSIRRAISSTVVRAASLARQPSAAPPPENTVTEEPEKMTASPPASITHLATAGKFEPTTPSGSATSKEEKEDHKRQESTASSDVAGPRFADPHMPPPTPGERNAGDPAVYIRPDGSSPFVDNMIRERVSTQGIIRPMEPENELGALQIPPAIIGEISELAAKRYIEGRAKFDKKFARTIKHIEKERQRNLERAKKDTLQNLAHLQMYLPQDEEAEESDAHKKGKGKKSLSEGIAAASGSWLWAWALDADERPPPSSIVARRDTQEARRLARIADQHLVPEEARTMTGNSLWSIVIDFLTVGPAPSTGHDRSKSEGSETATDSSPSSSKLSRFRFRRKSTTAKHSTAASSPNMKDTPKGP